MKTSPYVNYLAPIVNIKIGDYIFSEINLLEIDASCSEIAALCTLGLPYITNQSELKINVGNKIEVYSGYVGFELKCIFTGIIQKVEERKSDFLINSMDMTSKLINTWITRTYKNETPSTIIKSLILEAGLKEFEIDEGDYTLDRLPLVNNNIIEALYLLTHRLKIEYNFWFDQYGKFFWVKNDSKQHSGYMLEWGKNIITLKKLYSGVISLSTIGLPLHHSQLLNVIDKTDLEKTYLIERVKHMFGPGVRGLRTTLWLSKVS